MNTAFLIFIFIIGLCIGSFLNVCIYRIPERKSIIKPGSHCFRCHSPIKPYDNIPILSYIFLGGKCRMCGALISFQYPAVEFATALLFVFFFLRSGLDLRQLANFPSSGVVILFIYAYLAAMIVITMIDYTHQIIPDRISIPGIACGYLLTLYRSTISNKTHFILARDITDSVLGSILGAALFYIIIVVSRGGMGYGDVKLAAMIGSFMGWKMLLVVVLLAVISGAIIGIILLLTGIKKRKEPIPFGPFLAIMSLLTMIYGSKILEFYLGFISFK
ncbi:prepilin peptidase [bacterium]|nr:prepilin peptidase [bacterium]